MADENANAGAGEEQVVEKPWQETLRDIGKGGFKTADDTDGAGGGDGEGDGKGVADDKGAAKGDSADKGEDKGGGGEASGGTVQLGKDEIVAMFEQAVKAAQPAAQPKQYTEEELAKILNIFTAGEEHLKQLGIESTPEKAKAFNEILQNVAKQATSVATFELRAAIDAMTERLKPVFEHMQRTQAESVKERFFKKHEDLEGLEPIVVTAYQALKARGVKFNSEDEAFKAVAEETRSLLAKIPGYSKDGKNGAKAQSQDKGQPKPSRKMPALSSGGQGGAGDASGQPSGPKWKSVLS